MASRSKRFIAGLAAGYGSILVNVVFTLISIPLALKYLDKDRFGLWTLATQINGYLTLIDLGMSDAVSRFIADYKDDVNGRDYGVHLLTGSLVFIIQGGIVIFLGILLSWIAPAMFSIPSHLSKEFQVLLMAITVITGISVMLRGVGTPLWCFQRNDVIYGCSSVGFLITLTLLWLAFKANFGLVSLALAQVPTLLITVVVFFIVCSKNGYYPSPGNWGRPSMEVFKRISKFGRDVLFVTLGTQLVNASPVMMISRFIGLQEAAIYSIATKFYAMAMQVVTLPISTASAGLTELFVRGEVNVFKERYTDIIICVLSLSILAATGIATGNSTMVSIWTKGAITWGSSCDLLLGLLVIIKNVSGCYVGLFGIVKNWRVVRLVYFIEGLTFIFLAYTGFVRFGLLGVIAAQLIANVLITAIMATYHARRILDSPIKIWLKVALALLGVTIVGWVSFVKNEYASLMWYKLSIIMVSSLVSIYFVWKFVVTPKMRIEIFQRFSFLK